MRNRSEAARTRANVLRRNLTPPEALLWSDLKASKLGWRARRQAPIGPYILDFYVPSAKLCIEVDGSTHETDSQHAADIARDAYLQTHGIATYRIAVSDLYKSLSVEIETICNIVASRQS